MIGVLFGLNGIYVVLIAILGLVIPIWALVDAISRPTSAFSAAGSSKGMWIILIVLFWIFTGGILGFVFAAIYLLAIRPRVRKAMAY